MIIGIVAIDRNFAIGRGGKLPWYFSADLRHFKQTTQGHVVVMGWKTWQSIGKPLPDRINIVLSRAENLKLPPGVIRFANPDDVVRFAKNAEKDVFVIGGARTYSALSDAIEKWIVTEIPLSVPDTDTFLPRDFLNDFEVEAEREIGDRLWVKYLRRKPNL
ncbi:MAG: dihydrofolate reductase [Blastocatellia bacterium]